MSSMSVNNTNYIMFLPVRFRRTLSGKDIQLLQLLKLTDDHKYQSAIKDMARGVYSSMQAEFIGEYSHNNELMFVFIETPQKIINYVENKLNEQTSSTESNTKKITKIIFSEEAEQPVCCLEENEHEWLTSANIKKCINKETNKEELLHDYPHVYDVLNPIFRFPDIEVEPFNYANIM